MATYHAIAATGQAILGVLADACPKPEFATAQFELYQTTNFQTPMEEGISLYLYRVAVNRTRRTLPTRPNANGRRNIAPLAVDLSYLLTAWAKTAAKQQRLLGWAMRMLEDAPSLPAGVLNHYGPEPDTFRPEETVELIAELLSLPDMSNIWDLLKPNIPLSVTYIARLVDIESLQDATEASPVQTRVLELAKGPNV